MVHQGEEADPHEEETAIGLDEKVAAASDGRKSGQMTNKREETGDLKEDIESAHVPRDEIGNKFEARKIKVHPSKTNSESQRSLALVATRRRRQIQTTHRREQQQYNQLRHILESLRLWFMLMIDWARRRQSHAWLLIRLSCSRCKLQQ
jgi:hypothetical protein